MEPASQYVLAIDSSTSSTKVEIYSTGGKIMTSLLREHQIISPEPGWAENDPKELINNLYALISQAMKAGVQVQSIGICNQRETVVAWRRSTSQVLNNSICWCDGRTNEICEELIEKFGGNHNHLKATTGLPISTYFSAFKMVWLLRHVPEVAKAHEEDDLCFGNVNTWILWNLTQGQKFETDCSNASRTFLVNLKSLEYCEDILQELGIRRSSLPKIRPTFCDFGPVTDERSPLRGVPISCMIGDQQAASFGHGILKPGIAKNTYGTGAFLMVNTGSKLILNLPGLVASVYYQLEGQEAVYCLEGAIECGANTLNWLKDSLKLFSDFTQINKEIPREPTGVYFLPAFGGIYSPFWENNAASIILGCTLFTKPGHLFRAALEGIAYRTKDCIIELNKELQLEELLVDGGVTKSRFLLEFQQKILDIKVKLSINANCTVFGAALGAAVSQRLIPLESIPSLVSEQTDIQAGETWDLHDNYAVWAELCQSAIKLGNFAAHHKQPQD